MFFSPSTSPPGLLSIFGIITLVLIAALLFLSFLSLAFIFHLSFLSRRSPRLLRFTSISTVRSFLVFLVIFWSLNEALRLPHLSPFLLPHSFLSSICKLQASLSFGLFQPAFLLTLLFLVQVSTRKRRPRGFLTLSFILASCLPFLALQIIFLFFVHLENYLPQVFSKSCHFSHSSLAVCAYPLVSTAIFAVFLVLFLPSFCVSCWLVVSLVINKGLRRRIWALGITVASSLAVEMVVLGLLGRWNPGDAAYEGGCLIVFLCMSVRAAAGEGILVIKPIADSLAAGEEPSRELLFGGTEAADTATECSL